MKTISTWRCLVILAGFTILVSSCKKEDAAPVATGLTLTTLQGTWAIATSQGTEWKKGTGIVTPRADDPSMIGLKFVISATQVTVKDIFGTVMYGPESFTFNETDKTILIGADGNTGLGLFNIADFVAGTSMSWNQREPIDADYSFQAGCACELYFQKFWTFAKMP